MPKQIEIDGRIIKRTEILFTPDVYKLLGRRNCTMYMTYRAWCNASRDFFNTARLRNIELKVLEWL